MINLIQMCKTNNKIKKLFSVKVMLLFELRLRILSVNS